MSTKIYNAYCFPNHSLLELFKITQQWNAEGNDLADDLEMKKFSELAVQAIDKECLIRAGLVEEEPILNGLSPLKFSWKDYKTQKQLNKEDGSIDFFNFSAEMVIMIGPKSMPLCICYAQNSSMMEWLDEKCKKIGTSYSYWDNSDKPDEISGMEWGRRKKAWNRIFKNSWIPKEIGWTSTLVSESRLLKYPNIQGVFKLQDSFESRCNEQIKNVAIHQMLQAELLINPALDVMEYIWSASLKISKREWDGLEKVEENVKKALWPYIPEKSFASEDLSLFHVDFEQKRLEEHLISPPSKFSKPRI